MTNQRKIETSQNRKIAILGFGLEGRAVLRHLIKNPAYKDSEITIGDKNPELKIKPANKKINLELGAGYLNNLSEFDLIFRSPGIPYLTPAIQKALKSGVKISSATGLFFESAEKIGCLTIGVTGTKGKGTTSTLIYKILKAAASAGQAAGRDVYLAGNIGKPAIEILDRLKKNSIAILELSSFQLQGLNHSPQIAVVLGIFPDHQDYHRSFKEYWEAKANIAKYQSPKDKIFCFGNDKYSKAIAQKSRGQKFYEIRSHKIEVGIPGEHNLKNALMAATVTKQLGVKEKIIRKTIAAFRGLEHRLEFVRALTIKEKGYSNVLKNLRINFYNDSASTNPQTSAAAIKAFAEPKIFIAGGKDKNLDFKPLADALKNSNTIAVILFGENKNKIKKAIAESEVPVVLTSDLKNAVQLAYKEAVDCQMSNVRCQMLNVIFSPGSASFDMFTDYKERGRIYKELVKGLSFAGVA